MKTRKEKKTGKMPFSTFVEIWNAKWAEGHLTEASIEEYNYLLHLRVFPYIEQLRLDRITQFHIQEIIDSMRDQGKAVKTIKKTFTAINSVFQYAYKINAIKENPCKKCELPRGGVKSDGHYLTVEQTKMFIEFLKQKNIMWQAYFSLAIYSGLRRGEMVALTWDDIDFQNNSIRINKSVTKIHDGQLIKEPKTAAGIRTIRIPLVCMNILNDLKKKETLSRGTLPEHVFINKCGEMLNVQIPTKKFKALLNEYNRKCSRKEDMLPNICLHDLRHTNATMLISEGIDIETVSHRLGHAQASVTLDIYGHALPSKDIVATNTLAHVLG